MREPAGTFVFIKFRRSCHRHDRKLSVIVDPRAGLMGLFESPYLVSRIDIRPSVSHLSRLWSPEVHAPRAGDGRIRIARRQFVHRLRSHQRVHVFCRVERFCPCLRNTAKQQQAYRNTTNILFHFFRYGVISSVFYLFIRSKYPMPRTLAKEASQDRF